MSGWRDRAARRQWRHRTADPGSQGIRAFVAYPIGVLLLLMGGACIAAKTVPIATRIGLVHTGGPIKMAFALVFLMVGAALMFGFGWPHREQRRETWGIQIMLLVVAPLVGGLLAS